MSKTRRGKASQEKRQRLEQWERYPVLSVMYDSPEQYAEALGRIEAKVKNEEDTADVRRLIRRERK